MASEGGEGRAEESALFPAWSIRRGAAPSVSLPAGWPAELGPDWAWGNATGGGVRVCIVDSGIEADHTAVGPIAGAVAVSLDADGEPVITPDDTGDVSGHGTACAGIVRAIAPLCELYSVRVLGARTKGAGRVLVAGLHHALEQGYEVVNLSLATTNRDLAIALHELADSAYFQRTVIVASAHNAPVLSYPWRFSSLISVASHEEADPLTFFYNPQPPAEFFARGVNVDVAWSGGQTLTVTGNSFAAPHLAGLAALILSKHPELAPFHVKTVLHLTATNVAGA